MEVKMLPVIKRRPLVTPLLDLGFWSWTLVDWPHMVGQFVKSSMFSPLFAPPPFHKIMALTVLLRLDYIFRRRDFKMHSKCYPFWQHNWIFEDTLSKKLSKYKVKKFSICRCLENTDLPTLYSCISVKNVIWDKWIPGHISHPDFYILFFVFFPLKFTIYWIDFFLVVTLKPDSSLVQSMNS